MGVEIDGSFREGGGQLLRTALSLSCVLSRPFTMYNIRKFRPKPGLQPQHLTCVNALAHISGAAVSGAFPGSTSLEFAPSEKKSGSFSFDIGTAGSTSLLLQALIPPLLFADGESSLRLAGGTHVPFSPVFNYIDEIFLPLLQSAGVDVRAAIGSFGFYPRGGGEISVTVGPSTGIRKICLEQRGRLTGIRATSAVANLPLSIAERQKKSLVSVLSRLGVPLSVTTAAAQSPSTGTFVFLKPEITQNYSGFSALGRRGKRAEEVGEEAARLLMRHLRADACLDEYCPDQIILYLALARGRSSFTTSRITNHLLSNIAIIQKFLDTHLTIEGELNGPGRVIVEGTGFLC